MSGLLVGWLVGWLVRINTGRIVAWGGVEHNIDIKHGCCGDLAWWPKRGLRSGCTGGFGVCVASLDGGPHKAKAAESDMDGRIFRLE